MLWWDRSQWWVSSKIHGETFEIILKLVICLVVGEICQFLEFRKAAALLFIVKNLDEHDENKAAVVSENKAYGSGAPC